MLKVYLNTQLRITHRYAMYIFVNYKLVKLHLVFFCVIVSSLFNICIYLPAHLLCIIFKFVNTYYIDGNGSLLNYG